jgi:anti-anti-sigma factor
MNPTVITAADLQPGICELTIKGSVDWANYSKLKSAVDEVLKRGIYRIIVNLKEMAYISSTGVGCFLSMIDAADSHSGGVVLVQVSPEVRNAFNILGLSEMVRFADSTQAAAALLQAKEGLGDVAGE